MRLLNVRGKYVTKNVKKYEIDWDKKSRSKIQFAVKQFLKPFWIKYFVYEEFPVYGTRLKVDILNLSKRIAIEVDGDQHDEFNPHFHNNSANTFLYSLNRDTIKEDWLGSNNFRLIRIKEDEIFLLSKEFFAENFKINLV